MEFFPKQNGTFSEFSEFRESGKSLNDELVSIKDLLSYQCPCDAVVLNS